VQQVIANGGPTGTYTNGLFTQVTICVPGTTSCQTLDGVLVDTGSAGLRLMDSVVTLALPQQVDARSAPVGECAQFAGAYTWGPVARADIQIGGETALSVPIQLIGSSSFAAPPAGCTGTGLPPANTVKALAANGILGLSIFTQDCGTACLGAGGSNPGFYYSCPGGTCQLAQQPLSQQVQNPVPLFAKNNNGVIIDLPSISMAGVSSVNGSLIFGIGTGNGNGLGGTTVLTLDGTGSFTTQFGVRSYPGSFIDSGSNALYFLSPAETGMATCPTNASFYCPNSTQGFSATNVGTNGSQAPVSFSVANPRTLNGGNQVFPDLAGPHPGSFDWGLPFFFGRRVAVAVAGATTPNGPGPYVAY
jgi:hypothetical protein